MNNETVDIAIVGGGPAGLTAALYAARALRRTVVFEKAVSGGQIALTQLLENYPGFPDGVGGIELSEAMQRQAERYGATFRNEAVQRVTTAEGGFRLELEDGAMLARAVIVTAGAEHRRLQVPGEERLTGRGVSYCATCDAALFRGQPVAVVGGGDAALDEGLFVARYATTVYVIHRRDTLRASAVLQERARAEPKLRFIWDTVVESIEGEEDVRGVRLRNLKTGERSLLDVRGVFIFIGHEPGGDVVRGLAPVDEGGHVEVDLMMRTVVPGLFAAGDVRVHAARQAVSAAGDGATAAIAAEQYLQEHYGPPQL